MIMAFEAMLAPLFMAALCWIGDGWEHAFDAIGDDLFFLRHLNRDRSTVVNGAPNAQAAHPLPFGQWRPRWARQCRLADDLRGQDARAGRSDRRTPHSGTKPISSSRLNRKTGGRSCPSTTTTRRRVDAGAVRIMHFQREQG